MSVPSDSPRIAWEDSGRVFYREPQVGDDGKHHAVLVVRPATVEHLELATVTRISQAVSSEFELARLLD